jgi:hypothetical protein
MDTSVRSTFECIALGACAVAAIACASAPQRDSHEDPVSTTGGQGGIAGTSTGAAGTSAGASGASAGTGAAGTATAGGAGASGVPAQSGVGGTIVSAGAGGSTAGAGGAATGASCTTSMRNDTPFGCAFAWGTNDPGGSLASFAYLDFMSKWVGYEVEASGALPRCDGCSWLSTQIASTNLIPVYYAYFIGYFGHANGYEDGNVDPTGPNLTTGGAQLIREHRDAIVEMYAWYAEQSARVWSDKPLVWLLEGDFVQYAGESQNEPLSYEELGALTADISCAIKGHMPNAVVAVNHSTWNPDQVTNDFWQAIADAGADYDLVWTTGVADNQGFLEAAADANIYNHATATYAYVHELTGRKLLVDTSFGLSAMGDTWSTADAATLAARIADGVIAANVATPPAGYEAAVAALEGALSGTCE